MIEVSAVRRGLSERDAFSDRLTRVPKTNHTLEGHRRDTKVFAEAPHQMELPVSDMLRELVEHDSLVRVGYEPASRSEENGRVRGNGPAGRYTNPVKDHAGRAGLKHKQLSRGETYAARAAHRRARLRDGASCNDAQQNIGVALIEVPEGARSEGASVNIG